MRTRFTPRICETFKLKNSTAEYICLKVFGEYKAALKNKKPDGLLLLMVSDAIRTARLTGISPQKDILKRSDHMPRIRSITTIAELSAGMMAAFNAINEHYYNLKSPLSPLRKARRKRLTAGSKPANSGYRVKTNAPCQVCAAFSYRRQDRERIRFRLG